MGGFFVEQLSWRWIFFVNIPIGLVALVVTSRALRMPVQRLERQVDYLGAALLTGSVTCLILFLSWSSTEYGWGSALSVVLAIAAALQAVGFVQWEKRASEPIMPLHLFRIDVLRVTIPLVTFAGVIIFGANAFIPLYLQAITGYSPTISGLLLVPIMAGVTLMSVSTGRRMTVTGKYKHWPVFGASSLSIGMVLLSQMSQSGLGLASALVGMFCVGVGIGSIMPTATLATQNAVEWSDLGVASSVITFFRTLGGVVGLAAFGALLNSNIEGQIDEKYLQAPRQIKNLEEPLRGDVLRVLGDGITNLYRVAIPIAIVVLIIATRLPERPLRKTSGMQESNAAE
jgi:MFS family permease